jgi:hypothetical protein
VEVERRRYCGYVVSLFSSVVYFFRGPQRRHLASGPPSSNFRLKLSQHHSVSGAADTVALLVMSVCLDLRAGSAICNKR